MSNPATAASFSVSQRVRMTHNADGVEMAASRSTVGTVSAINERVGCVEITWDDRSTSKNYVDEFKRIVLERTDARPTAPTVTVAPSGLEGWTSCCDAAVSIGDEGYYCKACFELVEMEFVTGPDGEALGQILDDCITMKIDADEGVRRHHALLGWGLARKHSPDA